jgi:hypothetical protein
MCSGSASRIIQQIQQLADGKLRQSGLYLVRDAVTHLFESDYGRADSCSDSWARHRREQLDGTSGHREHARKPALHSTSPSI